MELKLVKKRKIYNKYLFTDYIRVLLLSVYMSDDYYIDNINSYNNNNEIRTDTYFDIIITKHNNVIYYLPMFDNLNNVFDSMNCFTDSYEYNELNNTITLENIITITNYTLVNFQDMLLFNDSHITSNRLFKPHNLNSLLHLTNTQLVNNINYFFEETDDYPYLCFNYDINNIMNDLYIDKPAELIYNCVYDNTNVIKEEVKEEVREEVNEEVKEEVKEEVNEEVNEEVKDEVKDEINDEIKDVVNEEVNEEVNDDYTDTMSECETKEPNNIQYIVRYEVEQSNTYIDDSAVDNFIDDDIIDDFNDTSEYFMVDNIIPIKTENNKSIIKMLWDKIVA